MAIESLIIITLAVTETIEVWQHSSLMAGARARTQMWENKIGELLHCPFCLSVWVSLAICVLWELQSPMLQLTITAFAVARAANLVNDLTHAYCRTPSPGADFAIAADPQAGD